MHNHTLLDLLLKWVYKQYKEYGLKTTLSRDNW